MSPKKKPKHSGVNPEAQRPQGPRAATRPESRADASVVITTALPPVDAVSSIDAVRGTKVDPLASISPILGLLFFILQENGVQVGWVLSLLIYSCLLAATLWTVRKVTFESGRAKQCTALASFLLFGFAGFIGTRQQYRHDHPASLEVKKLDDQKQLLALARLTQQGWKRQIENGKEFFELSNQPLPDMREATSAFVALGHPISLRLQSIPDLSGLSLLGMADVCNDIWIGASNLTSVNDLRTFTHLKKLGISQVPFDNGEYVDLSPLGDLKELKTLNLNSDRPISTDFLAELTGLERLDLTATPLRTTKTIEGLKSLRYLGLMNTFSPDMTVLQQFPKLEELHIGETELSSLIGMTKPLSLRALGVSSDHVIDTRRLPIDDRLESLYLYGNAVNLAGLQKAPHLRTLYMQDISLTRYGHIESIDALRNLKELQHLTINQYDVKNLSFLTGCQGLESVTMYTVPIHSIDELASLPNLTEIRVANAPLDSVSALRNSKSLNTLMLAVKNIRADELDALRDKGVRIIR